MTAVKVSYLLIIVTTPTVATYIIFHLFRQKCLIHAGTNGSPSTCVLSCLLSINTVQVTCEKTIGDILTCNFTVGSPELKHMEVFEFQ